MAEEDAHELAYTVGQCQLPEPEDSLDLIQTTPLAARRSHSDLEMDSGSEGMAAEDAHELVPCIGYQMFCRAISHLEMDSDSRGADLRWESMGVSDASSDEEQSMHATGWYDSLYKCTSTRGNSGFASLERAQTEAELPSGGVENIRSHIVEIASDIKEELSCQLEKVGVQAEMIYRVPRIIRSLDEDAYTPQFVSFGPYHRGIEALSSANKYKWCFLRQILNINKEITLERYLEGMDQVKQEAKDCYEEDIQNDGIKMLLLDGCCILGFLGILPLPQHQVGAPPEKQENVVVEGSTVRQHIRTVKRKLARTADSAVITLWHHDSIRHDLLLMENQLPFFVLQEIYDLATARTAVAGSLSLIDKVDQTIQKLLDSYPLNITTKQSFDHLLHCCHLKFKPSMANSSSSSSQPTDELQQWRGATDLYKAGIRFKSKLCDPSESLLDVKLVSGRTLMIPTLIIEDSTRSVFRNLIAYEQSCTRENYFAAYAVFMGELMGTPGDVTLLVKEGVVKNYIGADKEVSDFFNSLVKGVVFDVNREHFLSSPFKELNSYYNNVGNKYLADLKQNYCGSPWLVISVVAAAVVLVCTVVQTVFAVIG